MRYLTIVAAVLLAGCAESVKTDMPLYPEAAMAEHIEGQVKVRVL